MSAEEVQNALMRIAMLCLAGMLLLALLTWLRPPAYEKLVESAMDACKQVVMAVIVGKAALAFPTSRPPAAPAA